MKRNLFLSLALPTIVALVSPAAEANDWSPEDTDFDPTVFETIIEGHSRLGDPTPFYKEGVGVQSYTVVEAREDNVLGATINFALIVPFVPGQTGPQDGGAMYLSVVQAETLVGYLEEALAAPDKEREIGKVFPDDYYQQWTVKVVPTDSRPVVLEMEMNEETDRYHFAINPTKKLIDTLKKVTAKAQEISSGG